jgi:hypothetical protein
MLNINPDNQRSNYSKDSRGCHSDIEGLLPTIKPPNLNLLESIVNTRKESLLLEADEILRKQVIVCPALEVGTHPQIDLSKVVKAHLGRDEYATFHKLISSLKIGRPLNIQQDEIVAVDKMRPHGIYDFMITQSDQIIKSRYEDLNITTRVVLANQIFQFENYCKKNQLYPVISYSVDPYTFDRKSAQSS